MTSQDSSKRSVTLHAFLSTLRQFWILPVFGVVFFLLTIPGFLILSHGPAEGWYALLVPGGGTYLTIALPLFSILTALSLFGFLFRSRSSAVYLAVGVSRGKLFLIRYFIGIITLLIAYLPAMLAVLLLNIQACGYRAFGVQCWAFVTIGFLAMMLAVYTLCVLVCTRCGTLTEGILYTLLLLAAPNLIAWSAGTLSRFLLPGSPVDAYGTLFWSGMSGAIDLNESYVSSLFERSAPFGPLTMMLKTGGQFEKILYLSPMDAELARLAHPQNWWLSLGWLAVTVAFALLAFFLFKSRKGEQAGFSGMCPALGMGASVLLGGFVFVLCVRLLPLPAALTLLIAAVGMALISCLMMLVAFRGIRRCRRQGKRLLALPISLAGVLLVSVLLAAGWFGTAGRVPAVKDIEKAEISYHGNLSHVEMVSSSRTDWEYEAFLDCTSQADLERVTALHQVLISAGRPQIGKSVQSYEETAVYGPVEIRYTLKNGRKVRRIYDVTTLAAMKELLTLDDTDACRQETADRIKRLLIEEQEEVSLEDAFLRETLSVDLTDEERWKLMDCLLQDMDEESVAARYFPESMAKALLYIGRPQHGTTYTSISMQIYLTDHYTRTLDFLRERGLTELPGPPSVEEITIYEARPLNKGGNGTRFSQDRVIHSDPYPPYSAVSDRTMGTMISSDLLPELLPHLRSVYHCSEPLYVVQLHYKVSVGEEERLNSVSLLLPEKDLPDAVREAIQAQT